MPELKGIGAEVYLVGGFTRDYLLGKESNDVDIMCVYPAWAKKTEMDNDVFDFLKNVGMIVSKYVHYIDKDPVSGQPVSAIFPIHSDITLSNQGTLTLTSARQGGGDLSERMHLDIALARTEAYSEETRKPTVKPASFMADANRRDFTINTIMKLGLSGVH